MTGQQDIRLVLADVDGTLVTEDKVLTEAAKAAARELHGAGIALAITSGRPPRGMSMLVEPLALRCPAAGFNGGVFVNPDLSEISSHTLDPATARQAMELIVGEGLDVWIYSAETWWVRDKAAPHVAREAWTVKFDAEVVPSFTAAHLARAVKIVGVSDDPDLVAACDGRARSALGKMASVERSQPYYLDVTHPRANKGAVVTTLSRLLDIPTKQIATIGDMPNDVSMFREGGLSIAMGNASDAVKAQAHAVTDGNQNEGFAQAIRNLILAPATRSPRGRPGAHAPVSARRSGERPRPSMPAGKTRQ